MTDLDVDAVLLDAIADHLTRAGTNVEATGASAPPPPDAGPATPLVVEVLARLCEGAAELAEGLRTVGSRVTEASRRYTREDIAAGQHIGGVY